ncbi:hypothetical protein O1611_g10172 [Lasiodiplodia mahajangana]|uniref:Uncharacterized protein n=1 Tax=Lasiodiplodia mahajangana TaxID=1108764 RepID=A0ACC2J135_9PEZI|nr:hypothetical protein O1611_g10172 [Lasiodiplodia mahajangana]
MLPVRGRTRPTRLLGLGRVNPQLLRALRRDDVQIDLVPSAFGKLFRRRNKKPSSRSVSDSEAQVGPSNGHHSDPMVGERDRINSESEPKRSASLPVTEFNKALRSHSIGPDDYMAIHSARNSLQSDSVFLRRRAATASDGPINSRLRDQSLDIAGLSPRPASAQGHDMGDEYDPDSIGRAVSVDYLTSRRRSRSLSQLNDVSEGQGLVRKRSEEIRYWRASQTPGPLSPDQSISNREEPELIETAEPTEPTTEATQTPETHEPIQPTLPPEPFNFGSLSTMRITQAASLEERVAALELKNQKLERLVSQLFQVVPGIDKYSDHLRHGGPSTTYATTSSAAVEPAIHQDVPAGAGLLSPGYSVSERSNVSFEDEMTFIGSIHPPTAEAPRPISNVTIRGATSLPSLPRDASGGFTSDHYDTLKALLDAERAMRHALEIRVTKLANMVDVMSRTKQNTDRGTFLGGYPNVSTFEHDDDDEYEGTEPPSASIDDSDAFETPREERPIHSYDVSDDEVQGKGDDEARKRAARTLSLGQLTLGKPKHSQQPGAGVDL